jgi:hypothetical protein
MSDEVHELLLEDRKERRADARHLCHGPVLLFPVAGNRRVSWPAIVCDMSRTGLGLRIDRRFELGTALRLEWHADRDAVLAPLMGRVVRLTQEPNGRWWHGCTLIGELEVAQALDFLAAASIDPQMAVDRLKARDVDLAQGFARNSEGVLTCAELLALLAKAPRARRGLAASRRRMMESMRNRP